MIAIQNSQRGFVRHKRREQIHAQHDHSPNVRDEHSSVLSEQLHRLQQSMKTASERLDLERTDISLLSEIMDEVRRQLGTYLLWKEMLSDDSDIAIRFHRQASAVVIEWTELYMDACDIADDARDLLFQSETPMRQRVELLLGSFADFQQRLETNEQQETELFVRTIYEDIGVGD